MSMIDDSGWTQWDHDWSTFFRYGRVGDSLFESVTNLGVALDIQARLRDAGREQDWKVITRCRRENGITGIRVWLLERWAEYDLCTVDVSTRVDSMFGVLN